MTANGLTRVVAVAVVVLCFVFAVLGLREVHASEVFRPSSQFQLDQRLVGTPSPLGVIASADGGSFNNHTTADAFHNTGAALKGKVLLIYATGPGRVLPLTSSAGTTTATPGQTTTGVPLSGGERAIITMGNAQGWMAWKPASTSDVLEVWELQ